jgi:hypothetical protein
LQALQIRQRAEVGDAGAVIKVEGAQPGEAGEGAEVLKFLTDGEIQVLEGGEVGERVEIMEFAGAADAEGGELVQRPERSQIFEMVGSAEI